MTQPVPRQTGLRPLPKVDETVTPSDIEAQKSVLVVAVTTPEALGNAFELAPWQKWFGKTWQRIARATIESKRDGLVPDVTTVARWLKAHEDTGDLTAEIRDLHSLADHPYVGAVEQHAAVIHEKWLARECIRVEETRLQALREAKRTVAEINTEADERIAALVGPPPAKEPRIRLLDAHAIFAQLPPIPWVIRGLDMCPGAPTLFAGYGYSGKSIVLQSMALQIAAGIPVWGTFAALQGGCIHFDYEQGEHLTRLRYHRLAWALDITPHDLEDRLQLVCFPPFYLDEPEAETILLEVCQGKRLAIIDSFRAACRSTEENSSEARVPLDMLGRVSERTGCAMAVIHHARKVTADAPGGARDSIRGSSALYDACGSVFVLEGQPDQPDRTMHHVKARVSGKTQEPMTLRIEDAGADGPDGSAAGLSVRSSKAPTAEERSTIVMKAKSEALRCAIRELFKREPNQTSADVIADKVGKGDAVVRRMLKIMVAEKELEATGSTTNRGYQYVGA